LTLNCLCTSGLQRVCIELFQGVTDRNKQTWKWLLFRFGSAVASGRHSEVFATLSPSLLPYHYQRHKRHLSITLKLNLTCKHNLNPNCMSNLSLLPSVGREMSSSLRSTEWRPSVADWSSGMSASCKPRVQLFVNTGDGRPHTALRYH